ncbi:carboxypeptidase regulatory-like domain-containing protein [Nonlabens antarcticus]|uniref:carboxypeptidase regulatory-like domain-containing protein n=1 Tax=Nonlabens antarcticus TaxID=392714 RepID=UPI001890E398|nr:carboxypeptidase regulatory-like domain-containing protein [Nonlabens antarcticus]
MNKIILALVALLLTAFTAQAQNIKITGTIIDSLGTPVAMANVIAYGSNNSMGAFGISNTEGRYQLANLKQDSTYVLKVSFLGLKPIEETVTKIQEDMVKNFIMMDGADQLDAISIVYEMPVTIKGDTIVYNADSFTNGTEKKLGDVLKKLPGMEVNAEGDIQVEGKAVERVFINGKEFFEGDSRLATKNIPADAISKVEVLKNFNNVSQLKGLGNDDDRVAINIRLKEGKEKFWFGELTAGGGFGGDDERYLVKPKAFYYSPNLSINVLTDFNNLGLPAFTFSDYRRFTGGRRGNTRQAGTDINAGIGAGGLGAFGNNQALNVESKFAALNASVKASKSLDFNGFAIFSSTDTDARTDSRVSFIQNGTTENTIDQSFQRNELAIFKLGGDYKPNSNFSLEYDGQLNISDVSQISDLTSSRNQPAVSGGFENVVEDIDQLNAQKPMVIDQSLNAYYTASDRSIFTFEGRYVDQEEDPFYNAIRNIRDQQDPEPFTDLNGNGGLGLIQSDPYNINQRKLVDTKRLDAKGDYFYILNKTSNLNLTLGTIQVDQDFDSSIFQILDDNSINELSDPTLRNNVNYRFSDLYAGLHYKVIFDKFTVTPGFNVHHFKTTDIQNVATNEISSSKFLPDLNVRYQFKSSESLNLDYAQTMSFSDVDSYAQGIVFNNYNRLNQGNNQLEGAINDRLSLRYNNFNMFNYTTIFGNITYTKQRDALQSSTILNGINQVSTNINQALANESVSGFGSFTREFGKIRAGLNANVSLNTFNNIINTEILESKSLSQGYGASVRSNYQDGVNFDVNYNITYNNNDNGNRETNSTRQTLGIDADWQIGESLQLVAEYDLTIFKATGGVKNNLDFLEASLFYNQPDSKWEYKLAATNLLNTRFNSNNNFGQIATSTNDTYVLPRYVYLQFKYDI